MIEEDPQFSASSAKEEDLKRQKERGTVLIIILCFLVADRRESERAPS